MTIKIEKGFVQITGESIDLYRLITLRSALRMQARCGLKLSRGINCCQIARQMGYKGRTAKALVEDIEAKHPELFGNAEAE